MEFLFCSPKAFDFALFGATFLSNKNLCVKKWLKIAAPLFGKHINSVSAMSLTRTNNGNVWFYNFHNYLAPAAIIIISGTAVALLHSFNVINKQTNKHVNHHAAV